MKKLIVFVCAVLSMIIQTANSQAITSLEDCLGRRWPGCNLKMAGISDKECCLFILQNGITPENSVRIRPGKGFDWKGSTYFPPDSVLRQGPCCILAWIKGKPCPKDAGDCNPLPVVPAPFPTTPPKISIPCVCPTWTLEERTICEGDSLVLGELIIEDDSTVSVKQKVIKKAGLYVDSTTSRMRVTVLFVTVKPMGHSEIMITANEGDTIPFRDQKITAPGVYKDTIPGEEGVCDSIVTLFVAMNKPCVPCQMARDKWKQGGFIVLSVFTGREHPTDWINKQLWGLSVGYEYRFKKNNIFKNNICWGESIVLNLGLRTANEAAPVEGCIECNNLPISDKTAIELEAQYRIHWLKGYPFVPSIGLGPRVTYHKVEGIRGTDPPDWRWGIFVSPEVEWEFAEPFSAFSQLNVGCEFSPTEFKTDWRAGLRLRLGGKKHSKNEGK